MEHLEQVYVCDALLFHELADSDDRADAVLGVCKEVVRHHALKLLLLCHMAGGVAGHVRVVPELQFASSIAEGCRNDCHLQSNPMLRWQLKRDCNLEVQSSPSGPTPMPA